MSNAPETYNEVMEWFGSRHHAGNYDLHCLSLLLDNVDDPEFDNPERVWDHVLQWGLLQRASQEFWVTPRGKVWPVKFAGHEILFNVTKINHVSEVEIGGWLRVSSERALHRTKLTRVQLDTLARLRPDLQPRLVHETKKVPLKTPFDCPEMKIPWTVWVPEVDARPE
jgi:hypothetical protein